MPDNLKLRIWIALLFILSACSAGGSGSAARPKLALSPNPANVEAGKQLVLTATDSGAPFESASLSWRSLDPSIATVDANGVVTGVKVGVTGIAASSGGVEEIATIGVVGSDAGSSAVSISGTALYEDKPFNESGFLSQPPDRKPIRNAVANAIAIDGFTTLGSASTDASGRFAFSGLSNNGRRAGIYIQIQTKTDPDPGNPTQVEIRNNPNNRALLAVTSDGIDDRQNPVVSTLQMIAGASTGIGGAFNILDVFEEASGLIQASPCPGIASCIPPLLTAYWEPGSPDGTYYDDALDAIFILGGGTSDGDTDEYDDAVIAHEYGHFAMRHFSKDDSPGGNHVFIDNRQDIRLSWSEGWGSFFSSAVRKSPLYVDTTQNSSFSINIEEYTSPNFPPPTPNSPPTAPPLKEQTVYATNEIAVAGVLWDLFDDSGSGEAHDQVALGFDPVWQTILNMGPANPLPKTIELFWILFSDPAGPFQSAKNGAQEILKERLIDFFPDATEAGEQKLTDGVAQKHTLYRNAADPIGDVDLIPFTVAAGKSYTLETLNLKNGADTFLAVTDASGTVITSWQKDNANDRSYENCGVSPVTGRSSCPPNDQKTLSSRITLTLPGARDLFAQVKRSPAAPPSAGLLGSYELLLTPLP